MPNPLIIISAETQVVSARPVQDQRFSSKNYGFNTGTELDDYLITKYFSLFIYFFFAIDYELDNVCACVCVCVCVWERERGRHEPFRFPL